MNRPFLLMRPGRRPAEVLALHAGEWSVPLVPAAAPGDLEPGPERDARTLVLEQRESLLSVWATEQDRELGFPEARAARVIPDGHGHWRFDLVGGGSLLVPEAWLGAEVRADGRPPVALRDGRWWLWPDAGRAVEVGDMVLSLALGRLEGPGVYVLSLQGEAGGAAPAMPTGMPVLGLVLVRQGFLDRAQLEAVLRHQARHDRAGEPILLGQAALSLGLVSEQQLTFALNFQQRLRGLGDVDRFFADHALQVGAVSPASLLFAMESREKTGEGLAVSLVREGLVSQRVVDDFDGLMNKAGRGRAPAPPPAALPEEPAPDRRTLSGAGLKSMLGAILQREEYMTGEQVEFVVREQARRRQSGVPVAFGQVAIEFGLINESQLQFAVNLQCRLAVTGAGPKPLGLFLVEHGIVKPSQISMALDHAQRVGQPLGEALVDLGMLSPALLSTFLAMQQASASPA